MGTGPQGFGEGQGGGGLTDTQSDVLDHLRYNQVRNWLESDVAFSTTLSTIWLSDQWGFKSGGKSVFFSSTDQDEFFSPIMRGIKNQAIPANQDGSGLTAPFYRKNAFSLTQISLKGAMSTNPNEIAPYEGPSTLAADIAVYGVRAVLGEDLVLGDRLIYRLWDGSDDSGSLIFEQSLTTTANRAPGFDFTGWWSAPAEAFAGETVYARITVEPVDNSNTRTLMVRSIATNPNIHWNELELRSFQDLAISAEPVIITADYTLCNGDNIQVDTGGGPVTLTVPSYCNWFYMGDFKDTWTNTNNVLVVVGSDTGNFGQNAADEKYEFKRVGSNFEVYSMTGEHIETLAV